jgi:L-aspartate oxidase
MVFAHRCAADVALKINSLSFRENIPNWNSSGTSQPKEMILITQSLKELQLLMSDYVGIVRTNVRLERAMKRLDLLWKKLKNCTRLQPFLPFM